jgi:hypothetical protein
MSLLATKTGCGIIQNRVTAWHNRCNYFLFFALLLIVIGVLMMSVPMRFPRLYAGFLRESVMRRQVTERDKTLAIRTQGLIAFTGWSQERSTYPSGYCGLLFFATF